MLETALFKKMDDNTDYPPYYQPETNPRFILNIQDKSWIAVAIHLSYHNIPSDEIQFNPKTL